MRARIFQVVTFATEPFRGNPAFVLTVDEDVPDRVLQQVAAQLREDVLATLRPTGEGRARLLFHTAAGPHGGAGHAMLAAAHVQLRGGSGARSSAVLTLANKEECVVKGEGTRIAVPWPVMSASPVDKARELGRALGAAVGEALVAPFGYVAIFDDAERVAALDPDMTAIGGLDRGAVIATARGSDADVVIRVFAPKLGLPEDPVCGTAHRIIVPYWAERLKRREIHSRQLSPRGGDLWCRLEGDQVIISGESMTFLEGSVELPL
jgi:predicted PhzF superfamily epimerase YddE/YHI9